MTPEGKIKRMVTAALKLHGHAVYYFMPVQTGYGSKSLDYIGWVYGVPFAVETKAPGKKPTAIQDNTIEAMRAAGGHVFVIDGSLQLSIFKGWLNSVRDQHEAQGGGYSDASRSGGVGTAA